MKASNDHETRLQYLIRDILSPDAVALIATRIALKINVAGAPAVAPEVETELKWFRRVLVDLLGGEDAVKMLIGGNK